MRSVFHCDDPDAHAYRLLTGIVIPRPIAWISTAGDDGVVNLAPHSFFTVVSATPPIVSFTSVGEKDTLANVRATGEFVVNVASRPQLHLVNDTSAEFPRGVDEAAALGIAMEPSELVRPPRVADSPASLECRLHAIHEVGDSVLVLGEVLAITIVNDGLRDGRPDLQRLQPVSRLGGNQWGLPPEPVEVPRPRSPEDIDARD